MSKTIILSNRLPLSVNIENDELQVTPSVGGLATGLKSFHRDGDSVWIGWSGLTQEEIPPHLLDEVSKEARKEACIAVNFTEAEIEGFYYGFSNRSIWPLFHYFMEYTEWDAEKWEIYKNVNQKYADAVVEHYTEGDNIWVHDYQLLLVPNMIRVQRAKASIGFFNHIPFPSYEVFRTIPWREEILIGMLGANLIGFHTYDYERHFLSSVSRLLRHQVDFNEVSLPDRLVKVDSFPMGIDYDKFEKAALEHRERTTAGNESELQHRLNYHKRKTPDSQLILSIDRLDYTKGIANRIRAFEHFLEKYPQYIEKIRLVMLAVPSRSNVPQYQLLKKEIDELVGRINGKFATVSWIPIWYFYRSMPFGNLIDLYTSCSIALLTPIRDGMNLVAKEYIATRTDQTGVLILSEMAGSSQEMNEAIIINPNNFEQICDAIYLAINMPEDEQKRRNAELQKRLKRYSVEKWANDFMKALEKTKENKNYKAIPVDEKVEEKIFGMYKKAKTRVFFLDYDGTLVNFVDKPELAKPDAELLELINNLHNLPRTHVVLISGRDKETMGTWWKDVPVELIAEHGVWVRKSGKNWVLNEKVSNSWMKMVRPVLETFCDRTPGSFIEEKNYSLAWHYRKVDPDLGDLRANELSNVLKELISNHGLSVLEGNKVLEIKSSGVNKGKAASKMLLRKNVDFIFAIGDDWTDEFMFTELPDNAITVKVGLKKTSATYFVHETGKVRQLLKKFSDYQ